MPLDDEQLEPFRNALLDLQAKLEQAEETGGEAEKTVELDQSRVGRLSRMDAMQGQAMSKETGRRRRLHLRQAQEALQRMEDGEYGDCLECGEAINLKRLEVDPSSPRCISCAEALE